MMAEFKAPFFWQQNQWDYLVKRQQENSLPHALLLHGVSGLGKKHFAHSLATYLLCAQKDKQACGQCKSCKLMLAQTHPDFYCIQPEAASKVIRVDQIRELITQLNQTTQLNLYKIAIINPADTLHVSAANSLLKTLEEPPPNTLLMLVTHQLAMLPATIRSRCQMINFLPPKVGEIKIWLAQKLTSSHMDDDLLITLAEGAPLRAVELSQPNKLEKRKQFIEQIVDIANSKKEPVQTAAQFLKTNLSEIFAWLESMIMDLIRLKLDISIHHLTNKDIINLLQNLDHKTQINALFTYLDVLNEARHKANLSNLNQQLILEDLFCTLKKTFKYF